MKFVESSNSIGRHLIHDSNELVEPIVTLVLKKLNLNLFFYDFILSNEYVGWMDDMYTHYMRYFPLSITSG